MQNTCGMLRTSSLVNFAAIVFISIKTDVKTLLIYFTMKRPPLFANHRLALFSFAPARMYALTILVSLTLAACTDDDEAANTFAGTYAVVETDEYDDEDNYTVNIKKTSGGFEITNFGDIMNVPVKATITEKSLTIPSQTFVGKSMTIVVSGHGAFDDKGILSFDYAIDTGDGVILEYSCVATRQ